MARTYWTIKDHNGELIGVYLKGTRADTMAYCAWNEAGVVNSPPLMRKYTNGRSLYPEQRAVWNKLHKKGYRAVKVKLVPA